MIRPFDPECFEAVTRRVIVVIVSGDASKQARAAVDAGCDAVLGKPCSVELLVATIRRLLSSAVHDEVTDAVSRGTPLHDPAMAKR